MLNQFWQKEKIFSDLNLKKVKQKTILKKSFNILSHIHKCCSYNSNKICDIPKRHFAFHMK